MSDEHDTPQPQESAEEALRNIVEGFQRFRDQVYPEQEELFKRLATTLSSNVRGSDVASRYGGEEFMLLLTGVDARIAEQRARELCEAFNADAVLFESTAIQATLSVGIASYPGHGQNPAELIRSADLALYRAKARGRNQVVIAGQ